MTRDSKDENSNQPAIPRAPLVPRDYGELSHSELVPLQSTQINLMRSPVFWMVAFTAVVSIAAFGYFGDVLDRGSLEAFESFVWALIGYLLLVVLLVMHLYSKSDKPFYGYLLNSGFVALMLSVPLLAMPFFLVFRTLLPGGEQMTGSNQFGSTFIGMFFGAGLMEELMKVTLVLFGAFLTLRAAEWQSRLPKRLFDLLQIRGPLDGLMMGLFGGAGFILVETGAQYIPGIFNQVAQQSGNEGLGFAAALMLLVPRVIGGMVGHMAWAGINGYFIGLAVIRPASARKLLLLSWLGTSTLHAMWNTQGFVPLFAYLSAGIGGAFVVACLLKARQLEDKLGRAVSTYGSIVVGAQNTPTAPAASNSGSRPKAAHARDTTALALFLNAPQGTAEIELIAGTPLELATSIPGADPSGSVRAQINEHPTRPGVLGLRNLGSAPWSATLRDGSTQLIAAQKNVRLAEGIHIEFLPGVSAEVLPR